MRAGLLGGSALVKPFHVCDAVPKGDRHFARPAALLPWAAGRAKRQQQRSSSMTAVVSQRLKPSGFRISKRVLPYV
ncbi:MAG: hypothetical protein E5V51_14250, partial [Mesorhizobium sp.]